MAVQLGIYKILVVSNILGYVLVSGRPEGAPAAACSNIVPQHSGSPSTDPLPYSVDLSDFPLDHYFRGETYTIRLRGSSSNMDFKGFMIQGRARADDSPVGSFDATGRTDYQPQCSGDTAATHTSRAEKTSIDLTWKAPPAGTGEICFRFAFVDRFALFWANQMTRCLKEVTTSIFANGSSSTSGDTATITLNANLKGTWQCSLDGGTFESCSTGETYSGLSAGTHIIDVEFSPNGITTKLSLQISVTIADSTPTPTPITKSVSRSLSIRGRNATVTLTVSIPSTFTCSLDGGPYMQCQSGDTFYDLDCGNHTLAIRCSPVESDQEFDLSTEDFTISCPMVTCPSLTAPVNGGIDCSLGDDGETNPGDTCTFTCDDSYELGDSTSRTCGDDGSWSGTDITCILVTSIFVNGSSSTSGDTATIMLYANLKGTWQCSLDGGTFESCSTGETFSGLSAGTHIIDAEFSPNGISQKASLRFTITVADPTPTPTPITKSASISLSIRGRNATITLTVSIPSTFTCSLDGGPYMQCQSGDTFYDLDCDNHTLDVRCSPVESDQEFDLSTVDFMISCPITSIFVNGSSSTSGDTATIMLYANLKGTWQCSLDGGTFESCSTGETFSGLSAGTHFIDAEFSPDGISQKASLRFTVTVADSTPTPTQNITMVTCPPLTTPDNGDIVCSLGDDGEANPGDTCTFTCDDDYEVEGSTSRTFRDDGTWSGTAAICRKACDSAGIDLVFVLDSSGSIRRDRWDIIREFTVNVTNSLTIGPVDSLVGVIVFSGNVRLEFNLMEHTSAATLIPALRNLPFLDSTTNTGGALELLLSGAQDGTMGLRDARAHIAIVLTDGRSTNQLNTLAAARALHAADIYEVYAVGLGNADIDELNAIASDPSLVFNSRNFDLPTVIKLTDQIIEAICNRTCPPLTAPDNGNIDCSVGADRIPNVGDTCTFSCDAGYELSGSFARSCQIDESWSGTETVCTLIPTCPPLTAPDNGDIDCSLGGDTDANPGDTCTFTCDDGYELGGSTSRTCGDDGSWSGTDTTCIRVCPPLTAPDNGDIDCSLGDDGEANPGDTCTFTCDDGHAPGGSTSRTCQDDGSWSGTDTTCTRVPVCPPLTAPDNGDIDCSLGDDGEANPGETCTFTCDDGYQSAGSSIRTCQDDGNWSGTDTTCIEVTITTCPTLDAPENGMIDCSLGDDGLPTNRDTCTFTCNPGFELNGRKTRTCRTRRGQGTWNGDDNTCTPVPQCPLLVAPENGMIVCSFGDDGVPTTPDDSCTFTCNDGYELLGSTLRRCQSDFTWDGEVSRCIKIVTCPPLTAPDNGDVDCSLGDDGEANPGDICTFTCDDGYEVGGGNDSRTCGDDGSWSGTDAICTRACDSAGIDIVFVLDSSGSIRMDRWELIKEFTVNVANSLTIGADDSLVGVIEYSDTESLQFNLMEHTSAATLIPALRNLPFMGYRTFTGAALRLLLSSTQDGRMGIRDGRAHIAIVVTDGRSTNQRDTLAAAAALHAADIYEVYAAGLGNADINELNAIASDPSLVFFSREFNLDTIIELTDNIITTICNKTCPRLTVPDNGDIDCSLGDDGEANLGDTCTFSCDDGYELTGSVSRSCQIDESWSGTETECILKGCMYNGIRYQNGDIIQPNCTTRCACEGNDFNCEYQDCTLDGSTCTIYGDPHYIQYDARRKFDFMGTCEYVLSQPCVGNDFIIVGVNTPVNRNPHASELQSVRVIVPGNVEIQLTRNRATGGQIFIDGVMQANNGDGPVYNSNGVEVSRTGGLPFVLLSMRFPVGILWDGRRRVRITVSDRWQGLLCGLCGNDNGDRSDDFMLPDGSMTNSINTFGSSWEYAKNPPDCGVLDPPSSCPADIMQEAQTRCGVLRSGIFAACNGDVDPTDTIDSCIFDFCNCAAEDREECYCDAISSYPTQCAEDGIVINNWRTPTFCPITCPDGMEYQQCGPVCAQTCQTVNTGCIGGCIDGCFCPSGQVVIEGRCRDVDDCAMITCPQLVDTPRNGDIDCSLGDDGQPNPGDTCTYTCNDGYGLQEGSTTRTCQNDGTWSGTKPRCRRVCGPLTAPDNGTIDCSLGSDGIANPGDTCTFTCDDGLELRGSATRECQYQRRKGTLWSGNEVRCVLGRVCSTLMAPVNGTIDCSLGDDGGATNGDTCTVTCNDGFTLRGDATRKCRITRRGIRWRGTKARCIKVTRPSCDPLSAPDNGMIDCSLGGDGVPTNGDICRFACNDGFELSGSQSRRCRIRNNRGRWTGNQATCNMGCIDIGNITAQTITGGDGATVIFSSHQDATFTCQLDSGTAVTCTSPQVYSGLSAGSHSITLVSTCPGETKGISNTSTFRIRSPV